MGALSSAGNFWCGGFAEWGSCGVREWCSDVAVWGICSVYESLCLRVRGGFSDKKPLAKFDEGMFFRRCKRT